MRILVTDRTRSKGLGPLVRKMAAAALSGAGVEKGELSVLLTDDAEMRLLNSSYRGIDRTTDVLSFPMNDAEMLGDLAISVDKARRQAGDFGVSVEEEMARLVAHGVLHILGHDHVKGGRQATRMREKEDELMGLLREKGLY